MANFNAFIESRNLFISYTSYVKSLSFEQWRAVPEDQKAAVLFVQFYDEICTAYNKVNRFDVIPAEDAVSIVLQYLQKNVAKILDDSKRFSAAYIYRVAYNCIYTILEGDKLQGRLAETPSTVEHDGDELNLFDTIGITNASAEDEYELNLLKDRIWKVIEDSGLESRKVANYLLSGDLKDLKKVSKNSRNYAKDPLRDIEVSLESLEDIIQHLRESLADIHDELSR